MQAFDRWWRDEGSAMRPMPDEDAEAHVKRIASIAWSNGAFVAVMGFVLLGENQTEKDESVITVERTGEVEN